MKKILIIQTIISPYRIPVFNLLNNDYDVTVAYSLGKTFNSKTDFKVERLPFHKISRFYIHKKSLFEFCQNFDVVIGLGNISWLSVMRLPSKRKRNFKVIFWGIGVRASYKTNYGEKTIWDKVRFYFMRKSDAVLFYSSDPIKRYLDEGFEREKLFVANNTVEVLPIQNLERKNLLFIGTLYQQKKIYVLLENYLTAYKENSKIPQLDIIGDGDEYDNILGWVKENGLANKIFLRGKIFDEKKLSHYFSQALACISPGQAGLSVLKSMGYGVPFITSESAITGGEIFNIENDASGILYENHDQLKEIILETVHNKAKYIEMGNRAKEHYHQYRRPKHMVRGMSEAIEYVLGNSY